jgi:hypothetical protein
MTRRLIRADGTTIDLPDPLPNHRLAALIGAAATDTVILRHMGHPLHVMVVDDLGYETELIDHGDGHFESRCVRARKPVNAEATQLYHLNCLPGTTHQIVGDVVIVPDEDFAP